MHTALYERLKEVAKSQSTVYYGELAELLGLDLENPADRNTLAHLLDEISRHEHSQGRPLLSAVVWMKGPEEPGKGFFKMAREVGAHDGDDVSFFSNEVKRVWDAWK